MSKNTRYVIQRTDSQQFWAGESAWTTDARTALAFRSKDDAVVEFVTNYSKVSGESIAFNPVARSVALALVI